MSQRVKRPAPERKAPIRGGWLGLFGPPPDPFRSRDDTAGRQRSGEPADPVARAVELGYRVVDDYVRQGQQAARAFSEGGPAPLPLAGDVQDLMTRWFQYSSELAELWFQTVGMTASAQMPRGAAGPADPAPPTAADGSGNAASAGETSPEPARVAVVVHCARPVEVTLDLRPISAGTPLRLHELRAVDPEKPRISDVGVEPGAETDGLRLRIRVAEDQPSGTYSGLVLNEATSLPVGTVAVRVP